MRTGSHVCRILITGSQWNRGAARAQRALAASTKSRSYTSTQIKRSAWQNPEEAPEHAQSQSLIAQSEDAASWVIKCDPFLPLELRSRTWQDNLSDFEGVRSIIQFPKVLADSNHAFPHGILTHIALEQRRWSAAFFLCQALLQHENKPTSKPLNLHNGSPWSALKAAGPLVDVDFSKKYVSLYNVMLFQDTVNNIQSEPPLDYIASTPFLEQDIEAVLWKLAIGQIWRCIGHVMLAATRENSPLQIDMVGFVLQVIAAMHTHGVMSDAIYLFEANSFADSNRKPPFLHIMSSRIMTALSDAVWKKTEPELMRDMAYVVASHAHKGSDSPAGENGPRLQALDNEVWLELILWACVHDRHYHEGVELLRAMFSADSNHRQWKTVPWRDLEKALEAKIIVRENINNAKNWYQRLASSMEGYSLEKPYVNLGRDTISEEVVARLCDGLLSNPSSQPNTKDQSAALAESCIDILDIANRSITETSASPLLYYISDRSIENIVRLSESIRLNGQTTTTDISLPSETDQTSTVQANLQHALLIKTLAHHVDNLDVHKALQSYEKLKALSGNDNYRDETATDFTPDKNQRPLTSQAIDIRFLVPTNILASLLNLVTDSRLFQTGQDLVAPFIADGTIRPGRGSQRSSALSDAVTHFAGISSNQTMLAQLREDISLNPHSADEEALRELFHKEIVDEHWFTARNLLGLMTQSRAMSISPLDIARIALKVMRLDKQGKYSDANKLLEILEQILAGQYRSPRSSVQKPLLKELRLLNQILQVLISIPGGSFSGFEPLVIRDGQIGNPIKLRIPAFNILLEAVVDTYGMEEGEKFVRTWCWVNPGGRRGRKDRPGDPNYYPFTPNLETLRILIQPFTRSHRSSYIKRKIFTNSSKISKDRRTLYLLKSELDLADSTYAKEIILSYYYRRYPEEQKETIFWAMDVCKAWELDQGDTFYSLLQPIEEAELEKNELAEPISALPEPNDQ